jgi:hypothetical protein
MRALLGNVSCFGRSWKRVTRLRVFWCMYEFSDVVGIGPRPAGHSCHRDGAPWSVNNRRKFVRTKSAASPKSPSVEYAFMCEGSVKAAATHEHAERWQFESLRSHDRLQSTVAAGRSHSPRICKSLRGGGGGGGARCQCE